MSSMADIALEEMDVPTKPSVDLDDVLDALDGRIFIIVYHVPRRSSQILSHRLTESELIRNWYSILKWNKKLRGEYAYIAHWKSPSKVAARVSFNQISWITKWTH